VPSPYAGTVTALHQEAGATVEVGTPIISFDALDDGTGPPPEPADTVPARPAADSGGAGAGTASAAAGTAGAAAGTVGGGTGGTGEGGAGERQRQSVLVGYGPRQGTPTRRRRRTPAPSGGAPAPGGALPAEWPHPPARVSAAEAAAAAAVAAEASVDMVPPPAPPAPPSPAGTPGPDAAPAGRRADTGPSGGAAVSVLAKPPVRKLARDLGVALAAVRATGPEGTVTRQDVERAARAAVPAPAPAAVPGQGDASTTSPLAAAPGRPSHREEQRIPVRGVRRATAAAMVASAFTAPHVTEFLTVDVTRTMRLRGQIAALPEYGDVPVSPLLFAARALLLAVRRHPMVNSSWLEDEQEIVVHPHVNLGIAAATERGLIVPTIKNADELTMAGLAKALHELAVTARAGKTTPGDLTGGTITITNIGSFGVDTGTPILNPGEAAILALGAVRERPWVYEGELAVRMVTQLALSFDHRIVDGQLGSAVLVDVGRMLADPAVLLGWG
jgi:pyruvate dehydrogenase E2 component (dihydrolipoamide acetyltransferase)